MAIARALIRQCTSHLCLASGLLALSGLIQMSNRVAERARRVSDWLYSLNQEECIEYGIEQFIDGDDAYDDYALIAIKPADLIRDRAVDAYAVFVSADVMPFTVYHTLAHEPNNERGFPHWAALMTDRESVARLRARKVE